jgi:diadenosine tetraphosphate (Ap4A) HIT family hydrolase
MLAGHVHLHVVRRWAADGNFMAVTADTRVLPIPGGLLPAAAPAVHVSAAAREKALTPVREAFFG